MDTNLKLCNKYNIKWEDIVLISNTFKFFFSFCEILHFACLFVSHGVMRRQWEVIVSVKKWYWNIDLWIRREKKLILWKLDGQLTCNYKFRWGQVEPRDKTKHFKAYWLIYVPFSFWISMWIFWSVVFLTWARFCFFYNTILP